MAGKVFISYRREDDPSAAARVRDALAARFGKASLFMDIDSLSAGQRFEAELAKALTSCDVFIAIIGPRWMDLLRSKSQMSGLRDFVRDEIALALKRKIMVVPVRVGRENNLSPLPRAKDLPSDIRDLVHFQKHDVVHENFARDIAGLADAIARARIEPAQTYLSLGMGRCRSLDCDFLIPARLRLAHQSAEGDLGSIGAGVCTRAGGGRSSPGMGACRQE